MATDKSKITISLKNLEDYDRKIKNYTDTNDADIKTLIGTLPSTTTKTNVVDYVDEKIATLEGATSFIGIKESLPATANNGEICIVGVKEYIYDGTKWQELGDETIYTTKATTIAGIDLQDNITAEELVTALGVSVEFATDTDINNMFSA